MKPGSASASLFFRVFFVFCMLVITGCAESPSRPMLENPAPATIPVSVIPLSTQILETDPQLKSIRFTNLLNFERPTDNVFVTASNLRIQQDDATPHTGHTSLLLMGRSGKLTVRLSSLMTSTQKFPGEWTIAGAYFFSARPVQVLVSCEIAGTVIAKSAISLPAGKWSAAMVDLARASETRVVAKGSATLTFMIDNPTETDLWCDDVVLIDNTQWLVGRPETAQTGSWTVVRRGMDYICGTLDRFVIRLTPVEVQPDGWKIEEANAVRIRLSSVGRNKSLTIFPDGRSYWDGNYRALAAELRSEPLWADQQSAPALIEIPEAMGRLDRRSPGDENNDGYNECRASYTIAATGPRLEATITPRATPIFRPMLEISGLPDGKALVTVEGRLVEKTFRLPDGTLLVEIPGRLDRMTTVNIRIE